MPEIENGVAKGSREVDSTLPMSNENPIGIFDSGVGGLTVVAAIRRELPHESLVYLGDTARVPYGSKSADVVRRYSLRCSRFLVEQGAKMVVVACNTASAHGLSAMQQELSVPVIGVIEPGAKLAVETSRGHRIGVIGTEGTVRSGSYQKAILARHPAANVSAQACPLFVPLAEEGLGEHPAARLLAEDYLRPLVHSGIDTLVLGCTHYPLLCSVIRRVVGDGIDIIDSASAVAKVVRDELTTRNLLGPGGGGDDGGSSGPGARRDRFFSTDTAQRFKQIGRAFLGAEIDDVQVIDL